MAVKQMNIDKVPVNQMSVDQMYFRQMSVDQMSFDQMVIDQKIRHQNGSSHISILQPIQWRRALAYPRIQNYKPFYNCNLFKEASNL